MFRDQGIAALIIESLPLPAEVAALVPPYLSGEWSDLEVAGMPYKSNRFYFFKESLHSNYCSGAKITGFILRGFFLIPLFLIEGIIQWIFCCYPDDDNDEDEEDNLWRLTTMVFHMTKPLGIILGLIICIIPALFVSFENTMNRPSGETIYNLLKNLHELAANDKNNEARSMISNIIKDYECKDHKGKADSFKFQGYLFSRDNESEKLYQNLKKDTLSLSEKAKAIASYMETEKRNAGKELYHIILDRLNPPPEFDWASYVPHSPNLFQDHIYYPDSFYRL